MYIEIKGKIILKVIYVLNSDKNLKKAVGIAWLQYTTAWESWIAGRKVMHEKVYNCSSSGRVFAFVW